MDARFAPANAAGRNQIIPSTGPHTQHYVSETTIRCLVRMGLIEYAADYGPHARVYRPVSLLDSEGVNKLVEQSGG